MTSHHPLSQVYSGNVAGESKPSAVVMFTTRAGLPNPPVRVRVEGKERSDSAIIAWGETFSLFNTLGGLF